MSFNKVGDRKDSWRWITPDISDRAIKLEVRTVASVNSTTLAVTWNEDGSAGELTTRGCLFAGSFTVEKI